MFGGVTGGGGDSVLQYVNLIRNRPGHFFDDPSGTRDATRSRNPPNRNSFSSGLGFDCLSRGVRLVTRSFESFFLLFEVTVKQKLTILELMLR